MAETNISLDELRIGHFIRLSLPWHRHPFFLNSFKITSQRQIEALRELGIDRVEYDPQRSDPTPAEAPAPPPPKRTDPAPKDPETERLWREKRERMERIRRFRQTFQACEKRFERSADTVKTLMRDLSAQPMAAAEKADALVLEMADALAGDRDVVLNLMNVKGRDENIYYHSLNVTVLSMLLGAANKLPSEALRHVGLGALFHDVGKMRVPDKVLHKRGPLTRPEQQVLELHTVYGRELMERLQVVPDSVLRIIEQHHEHRDGSGYPRRLREDGIDPLAGIVAIANTYDDLCNPRDPTDAIPPAEALALMFTRRKAQFDNHLLALFIKQLGVYPPGTIVRLSDERVGLVLGVDRDNALHPHVLVYDPDIPRKEAITLSLQEEDLTVRESIAPAKLDPEIYRYLNPRTRVSYFFTPYADAPK